MFGIQACQSKKKDNTEQVLRGKKLFKTYCVLCHGEKGDGKGRLAVGKIPPPANLTISKLTDAAKKKIITGGGESVGRSPFMPPWGQQLSEQEILDLIAYTNAIKIK
ncbi:MAG: cytochrome c [Spirochaetota bacterium]